MTIATQTDFASALRNKEGAVPRGITSWNGSHLERRFEVYRNNVAAGLVGSLASRFPIAEKIVGPEFFAAMSYAFVCEHPPRSPLLLAYGNDFPDFVRAFGPAKDVDYLADVMRLEAARGNAYHAADATPMPVDMFGLVPGDRLANLSFSPHPSLSIIRSPHPIVTIWGMNAGEIDFEALEGWQGEDALVLRPQMLVEVYRLPVGAAIFLSALANGHSLGAAAETVFETVPNFDVGGNLAAALQAGAFISATMETFE